MCTVEGTKRCITECEGTESKCDPLTDTLKVCNNGRWQYEACSGNKPYCFAGDNKCSGVCTDGERICSELDFALLVCDDGVWTLEYCPFEAPYCKANTQACRKWEHGAPCDPQTFVPYIENGVLYGCAAYKYEGYYGMIVAEPCGGTCDVAASGYGVNVSPNVYAHSCSEEGRISLAYSYRPAGSSQQVQLNYATCLECKRNSYNELKALEVPATYQYSSAGKLIGCTPW